MGFEMENGFLRRGRCYSCSGKLCLNCQIHIDREPGYACRDCGLLVKKIELPEDSLGVE